MSLLVEEKANEVVSEMNAKHGVEPKQFAFLFLFGLIGAIAAIIQTWIACKKTPKEALAAMENPGIIEKRRMRRAARRALGEHYKEYGLKTVGCMAAVGRKCSETEMDKMFDEVRVGTYDRHISEIGFSQQELLPQ